VKVFIFLAITFVAQASVYEAEITHYCNCKQCCSWDYINGVPHSFSYKNKKKIFNTKPKVIGLTASGAMSREGTTLAVPAFIKFGTEIYTTGGNILGIAEDRGGAITGNGTKIKIDVYVESHKTALEKGKYSTFVWFKE